MEMEGYWSLEMLKVFLDFQDNLLTLFQLFSFHSRCTFLFTFFFIEFNQENSIPFYTLNSPFSRKFLSLSLSIFLRFKFISFFSTAKAVEGKSESHLMS
jgi:hypothetical protein